MSRRKELLAQATAGWSSLSAAFTLSVGLGLTLVPVALLAETADRESLHSAYVINFVRYAQWPAPVSEQPRFVIVVLGSPEAAGALRALTNRAGRIHGRPAVVLTLDLNAAAPARVDALQTLTAELGQPHAIYVAPSHAAWSEAVIDAALGKPILTIGVGAEFVQKGGMLGLLDERGRVRFSANEAAIQRASVSISARVMKLARPLPLQTEGG